MNEQAVFVKFVADSMRIITGITRSENPDKNGFVLFPNPANEETTIRYHLTANSFVAITVYDMLGKEVIPEVNESQAAGEQEVTLNTSALRSGIYFVKMNAGKVQVMQKLVVNK